MNIVSLAWRLMTFVEVIFELEEKIFVDPLVKPKGRCIIDEELKIICGGSVARLETLNENLPWVE